jgi:hypothetical protein
MLSCLSNGTRHVADVRPPDLSSPQGTRANTNMPPDIRALRLQDTGKLFGVEGKLALVEYYALLPNPADFTWDDAIEHISYRLHLAIPILAPPPARFRPTDETEALLELRSRF